ncbi:hypothetical protein GWI33_021129 [Rhynchophorus ferrugineus]|nr:hypothetical protein GWI33_021129 [Rhynchophorus ferrugineus]
MMMTTTTGKRTREEEENGVEKTRGIGGAVFVELIRPTVMQLLAARAVTVRGHGHASLARGAVRLASSTNSSPIK